MPNIGAPELIVIGLIIVLLFGATKLPAFARSVGRSLRIFKSEVKGLEDDDEAKDRDSTDDRAEKAEPKDKPPAELTEAKSTTDATAKAERTEQQT